MHAFVLTIWLTSTGPEITMTVPDCHIGAEWYQQAVLWAARSGIPKDGPGWLCARQGEVSLWRAKR